MKERDTPEEEMTEQLIERIVQAGAIRLEKPRTPEDPGYCRGFGKSGKTLELWI